MRPQDYQTLLETSQRINWRVDDIIGGDKKLDFSKPFLPETFARTAPLSFLAPHEKLALNHIRAHGYLAMFELVETFILPFISAQASVKRSEDDRYRQPAFENFAVEEAKHIALFQRFKQEFAKGFGMPCQVIGPADLIGRKILEHSQLSVAILVLGIEWMSQGHYVESVKDDSDLDPHFKSLLKHHWMEEAQHAKLDALLVQSMAQNCSAEEISRAIDEYFEMGAFFDAGLRNQTQLDLATLEACVGRKFTAEEAREFESVQLQAWRWTILGTAMRNKSFLATLESLGGDARARVEAASATFC
jgi:hypothetical protein